MLMRNEFVKIQNEIGLHAKSAAKFINKANEFKSSIWVKFEDTTANAKSILGVLAVGINDGMTIELIADGIDENRAIKELVSLINDL